MLKGRFSKIVLISVPFGNRLEWCYVKQPYCRHLYLVVTAEPSIYTQIRVATFSDSLLHLSKVIAAAETVAICTAAVAIVSSVSSPATTLDARKLDPTPFPLSTDASTVSPTKQPFLTYTVSGEAFWFEGNDFPSGRGGARLCGQAHSAC
jgi:hypothetical protein